jgi:hypothetical protein
MAKLSSLSIENFRGIREGSISDFTDVNILVGRNNSGKTTIIEAITRSAIPGGLQHDLFRRPVENLWAQTRTARAIDPASGEVPRTIVPTHASQDSLLWYRQNRTKEIVIASVLRGNDSSNERLVYRLRDNSQPATYMPGPPRKLGCPEFCEGITVFRPLDAFNAAIERSFWSQLLSDRRDRKLAEILNEVFGINAESFQLLPNNQFMVLFPDYSLPLDVQGDGTRAAMRTLMTLAMLQGTLMMVEEPECHQHPGSLERFAAALCKLAKSNGVQLIVSTHSSECVGWFLKAAKASNSGTGVFHLSLTDGKLNARRLDSEAVESLTSTGVDVRFLDLYA